MMRQLWTKNGRPLLNEGNDVFLPSGSLIGRLRGDRVYGVDDDKYLGTLVRDRLVFRSYDIDGPERAYSRPVTTEFVESVLPAKMWGDEPELPQDAPNQ